ncbi:hypothetical protein [Methanosarcina horonobensis]|uniref:hypothetical protein n=1 Tax=Methanosarcina horonobensis TaxID=418008 RepID=UPI000A5DC2A5|nr:hypothetical protein [Methanosarcina horonobensis]
MRSADGITFARVREVFQELALDPVPRGAKRTIESPEKLFRLRSRHLRLLYRINYEKEAVVILIIEPLIRMYR